MNIEEKIKNCIKTEAKQLEKASSSLKGDFDQIIDAILNLKGKLIITGIGKTGHIGKKIAASFASTGTNAFFVHAAEAFHGDLGMISKADLVFILSNSGETKETIDILKPIREIGAKIVGISKNVNSTLIKAADYYICYEYDKELDHLNLAPTTSTLILLAIGDALAVTVSKLKNFSKQDFYRSHPGGALGKTLKDDLK